MSQQDLHDAVEVIHRELARSEHLDAGEVEKLKLTIQEIQAALGERVDEAESLSDKVTGSAKRFEETHPVLTENLGRLADILQQMGI